MTLLRRVKKGDEDPFRPVLISPVLTCPYRLRKLIRNRRAAGMDTIHLEIDLYYLRRKKARS